MDYLNFSKKEWEILICFQPKVTELEVLQSILNQDQIFAMLQVAIGRLEEKQLAMLMDKITAKKQELSMPKDHQ